MLSKETIAEIEEAKKTSDVEYHQKMTDALSKHIIENWKCPNEHVLTTISAGYDGAVYMYCREGCIFHGYGSLLMQIPNEVSDDEIIGRCVGVAGELSKKLGIAQDGYRRRGVRGTGWATGLTNQTDPVTGRIPSPLCGHRCRPVLPARRRPTPCLPSAHRVLSTGRRWEKRGQFRRPAPGCRLRWR